MVIATFIPGDELVGWAKRSEPTMSFTGLRLKWWARFTFVRSAIVHANALPTLVLARDVTLALFREEWPSPGGHPSWAADRSDRCPPKP